MRVSSKRRRERYRKRGGGKDEMMIKLHDRTYNDNDLYVSPSCMFH